ncbi:fanconi-associated nuclease 1-like [Diadema antillarum]|uniref:fanconi-associated nuclease 1-like n=1 Tax=Diadema antillarum TaxID=105358 RepID=UPI003A8A7BAB
METSPRSPLTPRKKRKRVSSLSPRRGKRKLSLTEVRKHVNSPVSMSKSSSCPAPGSGSTREASGSIKAFFAKAKPPTYTACPVCSQQVKLSDINRHLDSDCLAKNTSPTKDAKRECSPHNARRVAEVREDAKDRRVRRRLQDKFESSPLYGHSSSSSSASEACTMHVQRSISDPDFSDQTEIHSFSRSVSDVTGVSRKVQTAKETSEDSSDSQTCTTSHVSGRAGPSNERKSKLSLKFRKNSSGKADSTATSYQKSDASAMSEPAPKSTKVVKSPYFSRTDIGTKHSASQPKCKMSPMKVSVTETNVVENNLVRTDKNKELLYRPSLSISAIRKRKLESIQMKEQSHDDNLTSVNSIQGKTNGPTSSDDHYQSADSQQTGDVSDSSGDDLPAVLFSNTPTWKHTEVSSKEIPGTSSEAISSPRRNFKSTKVTSPKNLKAVGTPVKFRSKSGSLGSPSRVGQTKNSSPSHLRPGYKTPPKVLPTTPPLRSGPFGSPSQLVNSPTRSGINKSSPSTVGPPGHGSPSKVLPTTPPSRSGPFGSPTQSVSSPARSSISGASPSRSEGPGSPHKPREPYFMVNFKLILNAVLKNTFDAHLFNEEDHAQVSKFNSLSGPAQQLYVRLFQRKYTWFRISKIDYPRIAANLKPLFNQLISSGLVMTETLLEDLGVTLKLLMAPDLKQLAKDLKVGGAGAGRLSQKEELVSAIIKYSTSQRSIFASNMNAVVLKKAKKLLGQCVKLNREPRTVFNRIILIFSLVRQDLVDDEKGSAGQSALQTELLVNMGRVSYPVYTVNRSRSFFTTREDLLRYEVALQYENDIADALGINDFDLAERLQTSAMAAAGEILKDEDILRQDKSLPTFLRCFTAGWVYSHIQYQGVDILQKQRRYGEAVEMLRSMLQQTVYCPDRRGGWWDRLALNLDQHCKKQHESLDCIKEGLADPYVRTGHRLALQLRAKKILKSKKKDLAARASEFQFDDIRELPKALIKGTVLPHHGPGVRNTFISSYQGKTEADEGIVVCSVEQVALEHYKQQGYTEGVHGEGSTYSTLVFILFWEIVFDNSVPDVFCYPYQSAPLDLRTDHFFKNRMAAIQHKLTEIREADRERLEDMLARNWLEYEGDLCVGVSWELFKDLNHAKGLISCIGGLVLSAIAERILRDHRHCRGGMPDLTMWNPDTHIFRVVEVKGPGDRLSQKQVLWLDFFLGLGVEAEVCHVEAVGSKQLKRKILDSQDSNPGSSSQESVSSV